MAISLIYMTEIVIYFTKHITFMYYNWIITRKEDLFLIR
jgi:hypothetical protein